MTHQLRSKVSSNIHERVVSVELEREKLEAGTATRVQRMEQWSCKMGLNNSIWFHPVRHENRGVKLAGSKGGNRTSCCCLCRESAALD